MQIICSINGCRESTFAEQSAEEDVLWECFLQGLCRIDEETDSRNSCYKENSRE